MFIKSEAKCLEGENKQSICQMGRKGDAKLNVGQANERLNTTGAGRRRQLAGQSVAAGECCMLGIMLFSWH